MTGSDPSIRSNSPIEEDDPSQEPSIKKGRQFGEIDLDNRDPKKIIEEVKINFEDVLAEPPSTHSLDCLWKASYFTFKYSKNWFYRTLTTILGIPLSLIWGLLFACLSFLYIWIIVPCVKTLLIELHCLCRPVMMILHTYVKPIFDTLAKGLCAMKMLLRKEQ